MKTVEELLDKQYLSFVMDKFDKVETLYKEIYNQDLHEKYKDLMECYILIKEKKYQEALTFIKKSIVKYPEFNHLRLIQIHSLTLLKFWKDALKNCDELFELEQNNSLYWNIKGVVLSGLGRKSDAFEHYNKATELDPNNALYWNNKGNALSCLKKFEDALPCFYKATELEPNNALYWKGMGNALSCLKKFEDALPCLDKATELDPNNALYWKGMGNALFYLNKFEDALPYYKKAIELDPNNALYWNSMGSALVRSNKYEDALPCLDKATELDPNNTLYWKGMGNALFYLNKFEDALPYYKKAIELDPNNALYWNSMGSALVRSNKYEDALPCLDKTTELEPTNTIYWKNKANLLKYSGKKDQSKAYSDIEKVFASIISNPIKNNLKNKHLELFQLLQSKELSDSDKKSLSKYLEPFYKAMFERIQRIRRFNDYHKVLENIDIGTAVRLDISLFQHEMVGKTAKNNFIRLQENSIESKIDEGNVIIEGPCSLKSMCISTLLKQGEKTPSNLFSEIKNGEEDLLSEVKSWKKRIRSEPVEVENSESNKRARK